MNFSKFWPRRSAKVSSSNRVSSNRDIITRDLFLMLSYMSAISAAGIPRKLIFERASKLPYSCAPYFRQVHLLVQHLNYNYPEACRVIGESAKDEDVKTLLLRLSDSLASGEPEKDFLAHETQILAEVYGNKYRQQVESMRMWTDAFAALLVSATLVVVVSIVSTLIYPMNTFFILTLIAVAMFVVGLGAWVVYRAAPQEVKTLATGAGSAEQRLAKKLFIYFLGSALVVGAFLVLIKVDPAWVLIATSIFLFPLGVISMRDDRKVNKRDGEIGAFLRSLGSMATSMGGTVTMAISRTDLRSVPSLGAQVARLRARLLSRLSPKLCWDNFVTETGSEMVNQSVTMFLDAINFGGDAEEIGRRSSFFATNIVLLRSQRSLVANTFGWLSIVMHATVIGLLVFIVAMVTNFGIMLSDVPALGPSSSIPNMGILAFNLESVRLLQGALIPLVLVLSVVNAFAAKSAEGGHNFKLCFKLGVNLAISGVCLLVTPQVSRMIFGMAPST